MGILINEPLDRQRTAGGWADSGGKEFCENNLT